MTTDVEAAGQESDARDPRGLSPRNYLFLIIALIAVVCLAVSLILAFASDSLSSVQSWLLILFLLLFSVVGVSFVTWLVVRHSRQLAVSADDGSINWRTTSPEKQKRRLNLEVSELGSILAVDDAQMADLRAAYIVAEDLALRRIQNEAGIPLMRKVTLGAADFDAVLLDGHLVVFISVLFLVEPKVPKKKIKRLFREATIARNAVNEIRRGSKVRLLLLLVTQLDRESEAELRSTVADHFKSTPVDVDIRWMDFQQLQKTYSDA
ncbi:MAG: hypothetical protein DWQ47_14575 [Acidobacteria bacterium]|nr:MAG: hypothetical protein DWQ32_01975 [Acidobacteriota bacterium]REK02709.1 MAG: hypothetical protein DWQ38_10160 [Acidobacteriota bacterium]REK13486.1 MAG: hypothetical protein DWQ43_07665 [Acidobacteriota bacterium]REK41480.1 MAG: hypothetical protein DWQ47_14575 [Acidobacteriota bacterium]